MCHIGHFRWRFFAVNFFFITKSYFFLFIFTQRFRGESNFIHPRWSIRWIFTTWRFVSVLFFYSIHQAIFIIRLYISVAMALNKVFSTFFLISYRNLGNNIFPRLPKNGLNRVLHLKTFNNPKLREFPPPETFPRIQVKRRFSIILLGKLIFFLHFVLLITMFTMFNCVFDWH